MLVKFFGCLCFIFLLLPPAVTYARYDISVSDRHHEFQTITYSGSITLASSLNKVRKASMKVTGKKDLLFIIEYSLGGYHPKYEKMIAYFAEECAKKRGGKCFITMLFTGACESACTYLPLLADMSVSTRYAHFAFHKAWIISQGFTVKSSTSMARSYLNRGASTWFLNNQHIFEKQGNYVFKMSKSQELDSDYIDFQVRDQRDFEKQYLTLKRKI